MLVVAVPPIVPPRLLSLLCRAGLCGRVFSCWRSLFSSNPNPSLCFVPPPSTSTCTLAIFSIVGTAQPGLRLSCGGENLLTGENWEWNSWGEQQGEICVSSLDCVTLFCDHEHLQTDRRPLSSGCNHHPAAQDMEEQVMCRWAFAVILQHALYCSPLRYSWMCPFLSVTVTVGSLCPAAS